MKHPDTWSSLFLQGLILITIPLAASCASIPASPVEDQISRGQAIYQEGCATKACHGVNGEGIRSGDNFRVWPLVGEEFQRRNPAAQVIFDVVRSGGEPSLRALTDQQIYDAVAYELSLNEVKLSELLDSQNAPYIYSGTGVEPLEPGSLFPPPGNASLISPWPAPAVPVFAENGDLRVRMNQIALAASIGQKVVPAGGSYVLVVFAFEVLADHPIDVGPEYLRLVSKDGRMLEPQEIGLNYPVGRFHPQTIQPEHGTTALAVFSLPENTEMGHFRYMLPDGKALVLEIAQ